MPKIEWFKLLDLAKELSPSPEHTFTAPLLAKQAGWSKADVRIISGWLYKFRKWGYVDVTGTVPGNSIRPLNVYIVTEKGRDCEPRASREAQLRALIEMVDKLQKARGSKVESTAAGELFKLSAEIKKGL